jgi:hypothetical protein
MLRATVNHSDVLLAAGRLEETGSRARRRPEGPRHRPGPVFRPDPGRPRHRGTGRGRPLGRGRPGLAGWPERPHRAEQAARMPLARAALDLGWAILTPRRRTCGSPGACFLLTTPARGPACCLPALPSWGCGAATWSGPGNWLPRPSRWAWRTCGTPRRCMPSACASKPTAPSSLVRRPGETAIDDSAAAGLLEAAWQAASGPAAAGLPELAAWHATALAETTRHVGRADPAAWAAAATVWQRLCQPYRVAYTRYRQAEALMARDSDRDTAAAALRSAAAVTGRLGARLLDAEVKALARRARLDLVAQEAGAETADAPREPRPHAARSRGARTGRRRAQQPADRSAVVHQPENRQRPRLQHPRQTRGLRPPRSWTMTGLPN